MTATALHPPLARRIRQRTRRQLSMLASRARLRPLDRRPVPHAPGELRLFAMARNEALRLPWFLDWYTRQGVDRIFLVDNGSTDATVDIARAHPHVHVYRTRESFTRYSNWMEVMLARYGRGHWCVAADLDEIFWYPGVEDTGLATLCAWLDRQGHTAVQAILLDMYSDRPIRDNAYRPGQDPREVCAWFDPLFECAVKQWPNPDTFERFPFMRYTGNLRRRLFGADVNLSKVPLFRFGPGVFPARGMHAMDGVNVSSLRGVVLHYKYLQDFGARVVEEAARGQHEGGARDYRRYADRVTAEDALNCHHEGSVRLEHSQQLVQMGLMSDPASWASWRAGTDT